jgi:hypothetical protein
MNNPSVLAIESQVPGNRVHGEGNSNGGKRVNQDLSSRR